MKEIEQQHEKLESLAKWAAENEIGAAEFPVLLVHAAGLTVGRNRWVGAMDDQEADQAVEALAHHLRSAAGLNG